MDLLTVGMHTYSGDVRYKMEFQYPNNWRLKIESAVKEDEGSYFCQISTHPPRVIQKNLYVNGKLEKLCETIYLVDGRYFVFLLLFYGMIINSLLVKY